MAGLVDSSGRKKDGSLLEWLEICTEVNVSNFLTRHVDKSQQSIVLPLKNRYLLPSPNTAITGSVGTRKWNIDSASERKYYGWSICSSLAN